MRHTTCERCGATVYYSELEGKPGWCGCAPPQRLCECGQPMRENATECYDCWLEIAAQEYEELDPRDEAWIKAKARSLRRQSGTE